ncbi:MAG: FecCD family ABC transporter permease [Puniceicoccales bacterium]
MPLRIPAKRRKWVHAGLIFTLFAISWFSLGYGALDLSWGQIGQVFVEKIAGPTDEADPVANAVVWQIRLPRIFMAMLVGAGLAVSGALLQGLFRNPLADPGLIGVSAGSAIGGVLAIVLLPNLGLSGDWLTYAALPICAMAGGVGVTFLIYNLSRVGGRIHVASMLLTGIAINAIGGAVIGLLLTVVATDEQLRTVTFWSLGSLAGATWTVAGLVCIVLIPGLFIAFKLGKPLNAFLFGELEAYHLGVDVPKIKQRVIVLSALMVGITVAFTGGIGFIGLVAPHIVRLAFGPDHRLLIPASALCGAILLLLADTIARTIAAPAELSIGILTALLGGPFFLMLLLKSRKDVGL